ncbi:N-acetyltransferase 9 [Coemansia sp. RSA 2611]|nr:N-acetyltransferase 9 [Coemansia sp. RSA 2611]KAJ2737499.1 N-acetyltransferase 9 [Coemansia sp. Cherry 401B]
MRANEKLAIVGRQVALVPYEKEHVPRYHEWMKSPYLQEMTGSEPLSIDEEYAMQQTWRTDDDKCTFIVLSKDAGSTACNVHDTSRMIGDVNIYLNNADNPHEAELEVMIAEETHAGKGIATEVLRLMMGYAVSDIGVDDFVVRIKEYNSASIHIFENKLGFVETERAPVFKEVTLRRKVDDELKASLAEWTGHAARIEFAK